MEWKYILASVVFSLVGIFVLGVCFWFFEKITPENLWKEIIEKHNMALAIVAGAFMISMAIIIGSAIHS
jgi:putative membrane protein